jgi:hypothetical protein
MKPKWGDGAQVLLYPRERLRPSSRHTDACNTETHETNQSA